MPKRINITLLFALSLALLLMALPVRAMTMIQHIDGQAAQLATFLEAKVVGRLNLMTTNVNSTKERLSKGIAGAITNSAIYQGAMDAKNWATDQISSATQWVSDQVSSATQWAGDQLSSAASWVGDQASAAKDWVVDSLGMSSGENSGKSITEQATDYLKKIPGAGFVSDLFKKGNTITNVVGTWGSKAVAAIGLTSLVDTSSEESINKSLMFSNPENMSMAEIQKVRKMFNNVAQDIASTAVAVGAASIQNATLYDATVDKNNKDAGGKTTVEIAQEAKDLRGDLKNWNGTTSTWLIMTNASLAMDVDRIALEAGTTLQDTLSSTNPVESAIGGVMGGGMGGALGAVGSFLK